MEEDGGKSVVIGEYVQKSSSEVELLSSLNIVMTAIHESGHFFGLRHTSATKRDLNLVMSDYEGNSYKIADMSIIEDGLTDTPFCEYILKSGLYKQADIDLYSNLIPNAVYMENASYVTQSPIYKCPDLDNIMFPVTVDEKRETSFTKQQMELVRSSLVIFPH